MSYSGYKSSSRGGGGYRGRGGGGGYRGSRGGEGGGWRGGGGRGYSGGRGGGGARYGGASSGGGGGKWERDTSGYSEGRSRYNSGGERYVSHGREDGGGSFRYRNDDSISSFTSRDHSHRAASPERKRLRADYSPASTMHRSHDYSDGNESYSSRSYGGGYENKRMSGGSFGGGGEDRRTAMFREERERIRSDNFVFRKPMSVGGPPRHSTPRGTSYRGRVFSRGRSNFRRPAPSYRGSSDGGYMRKRTLMDRSYGVRKRISTGTTQQDYLRRLKMLKIQRLRRMRERADKDSGDDEEEEEEIEEEIEEEVTDEDQEEEEEMETTEKEDEAKVKKEEEDEEMEEGGDEKKDEEKKPKKTKKVVKVVKKVLKKKVIKSETAKEKGEENDENKDIQVTVKQDAEGRDVDGPVRKNYLGQPFMRLECPHCHYACETFKEYALHLHKSMHAKGMVAVSLRVRETLGKIRGEQREEQKDLDEECKDMKMRTMYCVLCKLNYRSLKSEHTMSEKHRELKKLINPFCKVCRLHFMSPMLYENHICTLDHLKRKHYFDKKQAERQEGNAEIDINNFMVLDQVGSGEEDSDSETSGKDEKEKAEGEEGEKAEGGEKVAKEKKPKKKKIVNLGSEYCKKMEVYFCDLCKTFLPRIDDQEQALAIHCRGRSHLRWYVKKRDDLALRKRAEQIHRLREEQRKALLKEQGKSESVEVNAEDGNKSKDDTKKSGEEMETEDGIDDKTWSSVDKTIEKFVGDDENEASDDDEDSQTGSRRYDRFKHSEKLKGSTEEGESKVKSVEEKGSKAEAVNGGDSKDDA